MLSPPLHINSAGGNIEVDCNCDCDRGWNWGWYSVGMLTMACVVGCNVGTRGFCCKYGRFCIAAATAGWFGHWVVLWLVALQPVHVALLWPYSTHAEQWRKATIPCLNWLNIRPVCAVLTLWFTRVWACLSASSVWRRCQLIRLSIRGGGGWNSVLGGGRFKCQCGWKSEGVIAM